MPIAKYIKSCGKNIPGNKYQFYITEVANVTSVTETSNEISAVTMAGGAKMQRATAEIDSIQFTSEATFATAGGHNQTLTLKFGNRSTALETFLSSLVDGVACGLIAVWVDNNGKAWCMGASAAAKEGTTRPINGMTANFDSGLLITDTDVSAYTVTLTRLSGYAPLPFDSTLTAAIIGGSAAFIDWS